jgi:hypothetical protein
VTLPRGGRGLEMTRRWAAPVAVALACLANLTVTFGELSSARNLNDSALHLSMIRWARGRILAGKLPFDGWYPYLSLGSAQFHHYQTLPHILLAYVSLLLGVDTAYHWSLWLLLGLWPVSVYFAARWFDLPRAAAAAAAVAAPWLVSTPGYGFEHASYTWQGYGLWTQLWAMWLLPLTLGAAWRAISTGRWLARAAVLLALLIACHFLTGYLALLVIPLFVLVAPSRVRFIRGAAVGVAGIVAAAWAVVPLALDSRWSGNLEYYTGTTFFDSFGPDKALGWLVRGELMDAHRISVLTLLGAVGLVVSLVRCRRHEASRAILGVFLVSLLLFSGRSVVGPVINLLPGGTDLPLHRYISGIQLAGLLLAGVGADFLVRVAAHFGRRAAARAGRAPEVFAAGAGAVTVVALLALFYPALQQVAAYDAAGHDLIAGQQVVDATDGPAVDALVARAQALGGGRLYAGTKGGTDHGFTVGAVPLYSEFENLDADAIGMWLNTESLASDVETRFNEGDPTSYEVFNVRYVITAVGDKPHVPARAVQTEGRFTLWQVPTSGYISIVDSSGPAIAVDRYTIGPNTAGFLGSDAPSRGLYAPLAFAGDPAPEASFSAARQPAGSPGSVPEQSADLAGGAFRAHVVAVRPATVLLRAAFDPGWELTVDGIAVTPGPFAPAFVGRTIPAGDHVVEFRYRPVAAYPLLWLLGAVAVLVLAARHRWLRALGRRFPGVVGLVGGAVPGPASVPRAELGREHAEAAGPSRFATTAGATMARLGARMPLEAALGGLVLTIYLLSAPGHLQTVDIRAEFAVAQSIVGKGDFTVNPNLRWVTVPSEPGLNGQRYSHHGLGQSLLLIPAAIVARAAGCPPDPALCPPHAQLAGEWAAGFVDPVLAALTVLLFFRFALQLGFKRGTATAGALALAIGTAEWAYAHDTFDVAATGLFTLAALYLLDRASDGRGRWSTFLAAGAAAGFTVLLRLPSILALPVIGLLLLWYVRRLPRRQAALAVLAWSAGVGACLMVLAWFNWVRFGSPLESGYGLATDTYPFSTPLPLGLAGQLVSPGKSVFLFSPALVLALVGARRFATRNRPLALAIAGIVAIDLCFYGSYQEWAGDWGWGPRYLVPLLPAAMLFALPAVSGDTLGTARRRAAALAVVALGGAVQLLDVFIDYQHQFQLKFDDGIPLHSYWSVFESALWRDAEAVVSMLAGHARYPAGYRFTDASLGLPLATVPDTWWSYAWLDPTRQPLVALVLVGALSLAAWLTAILRERLRG